MGLDWNKLKETLNPEFDWEAAVQAVLKTEDSLEDVCFPQFCKFVVTLNGDQERNLLVQLKGVYTVMMEETNSLLCPESPRFSWNVSIFSL